MTTAQILRRIGQAVVVLLVTFVLAFILLSALPGDAITARYASQIWDSHPARSRRSGNPMGPMNP